MKRIGRLDDVTYSGVPMETVEWRIGMARQAKEVHEAVETLNEKELEIAYKSIVENCDVCFGVWPDAGEIGGFGVFLIRGRNQFREIAAGQKGEIAKLSIGALPVPSREDAIQLADLFEDHEQ
jgi:hypothetical protein